MRRVVVILLCLLAGPALAQTSTVTSVDTAPTVGAACTGTARSVVARGPAAKRGKTYSCIGGVWVETSTASKVAGTTDVDLNEDGTCDFRLVTRGPRGATTDASGDGTADQKLYQAVDLGCDGTPDGYLGPSGWSDTAMRRDAFMGTVIISGDNHGEDWSTTAALCAQYGIPCTFQVVRGPYDDVNYPSGSDIQEYAAAGNDIAPHSAAHFYGGFDTADGNPNYDGSAAYGFDATGTVVCTNGSATVEGTGVTWSRSQGGRFSPTDGYFICDWDNDNDIDATDRNHIFMIASVTDSNTLVLDRTFDGTTSSPARPYEIRTNLANAIWEIEANEAAIASVLGSLYQPGYWVDPGNWTPSDDLAVLAKAYAGVLLAGSYQTPSGTGTQELGHTFGSMADPLRMSWVQSTCNWTNAYVDALLAVAAKERLFINLNLHDVQADASCLSATDDLKRSVFEYMLQQLKIYQARGQLQVLRGEDALGYWRLRRAQPSWNLLRNSHFFYTATGGYAGRAALLGWEENDYDGIAAGVNGPSSLDCDAGGAGTQAWTLTGDGAGTMTWTYSDASGTCTAGFDQQTVLGPGLYQFAVDVDARDLTAGLARVNFYDTGTDYDDFTGSIDPLWYTTIGGFQFVATEYSPTVAAGLRRTIVAQFRIPEGFNQPFILNLQVSGGRGTVRWNTPVLIRRALTTDNDAHFAGGAGLSTSTFSQADPTAAGRELPWAFNFTWRPHENRRTDTPAIGLFGFHYEGASALQEGLLTATIPGANQLDLDLKGSLRTDDDRDGTLRRTIFGPDPKFYVRDLYDCSSLQLHDANRSRTNGTDTQIVKDTNFNDADPLLTNHQFGACRIDTDTNGDGAATAGAYGALVSLAAANNTSTANLSPGKLIQFTARVNPYTGSLAPLSAHKDKKIVIGGVRSSANGDIDTKTDGVFFWCSPTQDVDGDTTVGCAADADDCNWYFVTMNGATDAATLCAAGTANSTCLNTNLSCDVSGYRVFEIEKTTTGYAYRIFNDTADGPALQISGAITTDLPAADTLALWGTWLETSTVNVSADVWVNYQEYIGRR